MAFSPLALLSALASRCARVAKPLIGFLRLQRLRLKASTPVAVGGRRLASRRKPLDDFLSGVSEAPIRSAMGVAEPVVAASRHSASPTIFSPSVDPRIARMRRAAAIDIFSRAGLDVVPGQFWPFLERRGGPGDAVADFLDRIGIDALAVRRGDAAEVERTNDLLELLAEIENAFATLSQGGRLAVEEAIFSGEFDRVREAARIVAIYAAVAGMGARWPEDVRPRIFTEFLTDIAAAAEDPLTSTLADAADAEQAAASVDALMRRMEATEREQERLRELLRDAGTWTTWPEGDALRLGLARFDATVESLRTTITDFLDASALIDVLDAINVEFGRVIAARSASGRRSGKRAGSAGAGTSGASSGAKREDWQDALIFFGFSVRDTPTADVFKKRRRELEKKLHPSRPGGSDTKFQDYGRHRDVLMRRFGFTR